MTKNIEKKQMENIAKLQDYVGDYLDKELDKFYSFDVWKDLLVMLRQAPKNAAAISIFERYGDAFKIRRMDVDVIATKEDWTPALSVEFDWKVKATTVGLRVMIVKNKVFYVQLLDMYNVVQNFGDDFDYVKEFEKTVVLMRALRGE